MPDLNHPPETDTSVSENAAPRPPRRPVYEPSLLPERRRRRASPWLVIPGLLILLGAALYFLLAAPRQRRFVPTAGKIAYVSDAGSPGQPHLWIAAADGTGARRLTVGAGDETNPSWSGDGSQIAFLSTRAGGTPQVFVVDADGQNLTQITQNAGAKSRPAFAPGDPTLLGFTSGGALQVASLGAAETQTRRLLPPATEQAVPQDADAQPVQGPITIPAYAWAPASGPDQQGLAAVEDRGDVQMLALLPSLGGAARDTQGQAPNVTPLAAADTMSLGWSPDGGLLAVAMLGVRWPAPGRPASGLFLLDSQGAPVSPQPLPLIADPTAGPQNPVFSPDGTQIAFEVWHGADLAHRRSVGLYLIPTSGGAAPKTLARGDASEARFTADGQALLFLRARPDGGHDLCRVGLNGAGLVPLSDGRADVSAVAVSPQASGRAGGKS